jgi:glucan phosphoethanolaminetransferase (alkaline phosphatase superfamily)
MRSPWLAIRSKLGATVREAWRAPAHRFLMVVSLLYTAAFVVPHYRLLFGADLVALGNAVVLSWFATLGLFTLAGVSCWLFRATVLFLFVVSGAVLYFVINYHVYVNENVVAVLAQSNPREALAYVSGELILYVLIATLLGLLLLFRHARVLPVSLATRGSWLLQLGLLFTVLALGERAVVPNLFATFARTFHAAPPLSLIQKPILYLREQNHLAGLLAHRSNLADLGVSGPREPETIVLVIGESARADHFHINGYARQTTPTAEAWGMQAFRSTRACANETRLAVPCLMTRATPNDLERAFRETSFVSLFRRAGFDTSWLSNQSYFWSFFGPSRFSESTIYSIALEAEHTFFNNVSGDVDYLTIYDEELLPALDSALSRPAQQQLIVLHTIGSHWHCDSHYPPAFARWTPLCHKRNPKRCTPAEYANSYDNSILYTDHFLGEVMERLRQRPALLVYVSDHGAEMGEQGVFDHTPFSGEEVLHVPLLVWLSDAMKARHPERARAIERHAVQAVSHDWIFHSIVDCAGLDSPAVDRSLSFCR